MDVVTYIPDASTLVNNINAIKQWVYNGYIRILVPMSVVDQVEEQFRVSMAPKEPTKDHHARKSWGKMPRKEHPLFDINPRIAWEFLSRARSEKGEVGVAFQNEKEKFTQWEFQKDSAVKPASPPVAPSSFADALVRKLNIKDGSDANGEKGPSKPKLVARAGDIKSPWTNNKIPTIPDCDVSQDTKQVLSCALWRIYEFQNNSEEPETFALLTERLECKATAVKLGITARSSSEIRQLVDDFEKAADNRSQRGRLESDFSDRQIGKSPRKQEARTIPPIPEATTNGHTAIQLEAQPLMENGMNTWRRSFESKQNINQPREPVPPIFQPFGPPPTSPQPSTTTHVNSEKQSAIQAPIGTGRLRSSKDEPVTAADKEIPLGSSSLLDSLMQGSSPDIPDNSLAIPIEPPKSVTPINEKKKEESEIDSDEEVIVFKARRASGRPNTSSGAPKSRPTTSHSHSVSGEGLKPAKSPLFSTLKPQSPVFTPGQAYITANQPTVEQPTPKTSPTLASQPAKVVPPTGPAQDRVTESSSAMPNGPTRSPQRRSATPRRPRAELQQRHPSHDLQQQSRMIIQRQREAIERQVKAAAKPPPRQVTMEPTENPTVIDPDAFDRSYVVQQPTHTQGSTNGRAGSGGRGGRRRSPTKTAESPKQTHRKPSEKQPAASADVDFVLKSGQPRSTRGKGKLWVP